MLSAFPSLLSYNQISPFIIRVVLGAIFVFWAYRAFHNHGTDNKQKTLAVIEGLAGLLIIIGLWTQVAALVVIIDLVVRLVQKIGKKQFLTDGVNYYLVLLVLAVSLMVTGAGWLSFDLPL